MPIFRMLLLGLSLSIFSEVSLAETAKETEPSAESASPIVRFETTVGEIEIELFANEAPLSVANFLQYVQSGFYDGLIFHRVVPGFVVQAGGYNAQFREKKTGNPIVNESKPTVKNLRGTLSMARTSNPNSATSQFFINLEDNRSLDVAPGNAGYAVFGRVVKGMDAVDQMAQQPQGKHRGTFANAPNEAIVINKATVKSAP